MSNIYDKSSLVLIPSGTKTGKVYSQKPVSGDGDFTFTRSSAATRVNADGNIEKETQNLLLQSNSFSNASWTKNTSSVTSGQSGYDGTSDAWLMAAGNIIQSISNTGVQTFSIYAKANTLDWIFMDFVGVASEGAYFDIANGVLGTINSGSIDAKIESVGSGWYRCSIVISTSSATAVRFYTASADGNVSGSGSIYIQDAQLEQGLVARDYIETTTSAVEGGITDNVPRLDYTDSSCPALLLEPQRTNDVEHSEYFEGSGWGLLQASLTANDSNSPEGLQNAYSLVPNTTNTTHLVYETITKSAGTYTASCFFKADGYDYGNIRLATDSDAKRYSVTIDLTDGTFASQDTYGSPTSTGYKIEDIGNSWYRLSVTSAHSSGFMYHTISLSNTASPTYNNGLPQFAGDGTKGVLIYGAQMEQGSYATSYIPTYGSSVTRVGDNCETATPSTSLFGQTEGTLFCEYTPVSDDTTNQSRFIRLTNSSNSNQVYMQHYALNNVNAVVFNGSNQFVGQTSTGYISVGNTYKFALAYKDGDYVFYANGVQIDTGNATGLGTLAVDRLDLDNANISKASKVNQALVFNTRLSNEELADLTTL